jgi:hypothetical protein
MYEAAKNGIDERLSSGRQAAVRITVSALCAIGLALLAASPAAGSAWSPRKGEFLLLWQTYAYRAEERFDSDGRREPLGPEARFQSVVLQGWLEAGLTDRWTFVAALPLGWWQYRDRWISQESFSPADVQGGVRHRLRAPERGWQLAVQTLAKAPSYGAQTRPRPGNGQLDWEGSLLLGRSFPIGSRWAWIAAESGYRRRWGRPADQLRGEASGGVHLTSRVAAFTQYFAIRGLGELVPAERTTNPLVEPRFDLHKIQVSAVLRLSASLRFQIGWAHDLAGRNTGAGNALVVGLWQSF